MLNVGYRLYGNKAVGMAKAAMTVGVFMAVAQALDTTSALQ